jgi:iron complex outermembrane receptor protein
MTILLRKLHLGASVATLCTAAFAAGAAFAQSPQPSPVAEIGAPQRSVSGDASAEAADIEEVVVTGTSIRGVAPVGSNLVAVGAEQLEETGAQTITQALQSVPAITGMGASGQSPTGSHYQPSIHSLGASASNSTLVLVDGHRGPLGGIFQSFFDPNMIPTTMLERVEVLAEGASATYGSDAVSGVINFITRDRYDGVRVTGSTTLMDGGTGYTAGALIGKSWDSGSAVLGASYTLQPGIMNIDRPSTFPDQRARGGRNNLSLNCSPATLQPGATGPIYLNATSGATVTSADATCSNWDLTEHLGDVERHTVMGSITLDLSDRLTVDFDILYGRRRNDQLVGAGGLTNAIAFGDGDARAAQINPFYTRPAGYAGAATTQQIRWDATELFGPAHSRSGSDSFYTSLDFRYEINENWNFDVLAAAGLDVSDTYTEGSINSSAALLALNGTTNNAGNTNAASVPGTTTVVHNLPLTTANALDVWNPTATNRTSPEVRRRLLDNKNQLEITTGFQQFRAIANGSLFELPAGPVRVAAGAELLRSQLSQFRTLANNTGPASTGSQQLSFDFDREVYSGFVEANVPLVSPEMGVPLVQKLDVNVAYRYDNYSDMGETGNPRYAFNWDVVQGLRFRGNYSTSFVAPPLAIFGDQFGAFVHAGVTASTQNFAIPIASFPNVVQVPNVRDCNGVTCNIRDLEGIQIVSGDPNAKPQEGKGWSLGFDLAPEFLPGFRSQVTYWSTSFTGAVAGVSFPTVVNNASGNFLLTFYPNCATPDERAQFAQGIPITGNIPSCVQYIYRQLNSNWLNLHVEGVDYAFEYTHRTDGRGDFRIGLTGTEFTEYTQSFGRGPQPSYDILNTTGVNGNFPSVARQARGNIGWERGPLEADLFVNYTGSYRNWGNPMSPVTRDAVGNPSGGGDVVKANTTLDLRLAYTFSGGPLQDAEVSLTGRNITDKLPPFHASAQGYDSFVGNVMGRQIVVAFRADF